MEFIFKRKYRGPVKAVVFDLAGTVLDYGSRAPAGAFVELFHRNHVPITTDEARQPMGMEKKDHIRVLTKMPNIAQRWRDAHLKDSTEEDVDRMYKEFIPLQIDCLPNYGELIPGALETQEWLRKRKIGIATTTGYNIEMMEVVLKKAGEQGFKPDVAVCASDVRSGRPAPWMIFHCMEQLGVYPPEAVVKVGDTIPDIEDGLNAGVWSVGVAKTGNMIGMSKEEIDALTPNELERRIRRAKEEMYAAGAHFVIDGVQQLPQLITKIESKFEDAFLFS